MPGVHRADAEREDLRPSEVDAADLCADRVVAQRDQRAAGPAPKHVAREQVQHRGDGDDEEVHPDVHVVARVEARPLRRQDPRVAPQPLAVRTAGERIEPVDEAREQDRESERREREVQPFEPKRGDSDQHADHEADRRRDGDGREERPVVVRHEDRGGVRTDTHERAVAERDLAGEPGHDVEPQHGDAERRRLREQHDARLLEDEGEQREERGEHEPPDDLHEAVGPRPAGSQR